MRVAIVVPALGSHAGPLAAYHAHLVNGGIGAEMIELMWSNSSLQSPYISSWLATDTPKSSTNPDVFNLRRAAELLPQLEEKLRAGAYDAVVFDFFCVEAPIAAARLGLPSICSLPCVAEAGLPLDAEIVAQLQQLAGAELAVARASDAHYIVGSAPSLLWNALSEAPGIYMDRWRMGVRRAIIAFGTVVPVAVAQSNPSAVQCIVETLAFILGELATDGVTVATLLLPKISGLVHALLLSVIDRAPVRMTTIIGRSDQAERLLDAHVFVTHGGGSSVAEGLRARIPMWVVPFFGDQHYAARRVAATQPDARAYVLDPPDGHDVRDAARDMSRDGPRRRIDGPRAPPSSALVGIGPNDLVYGRTIDCLVLQAYLGVDLGVGNMAWDGQPRLVDHLNDALIDGRARTLTVYAEWAGEVARVGLPVPSRAALELPGELGQTAHAQLYALCVHGLGWWAGRGLVHFVLGDLTEENGATHAELAACCAHPEWTHVRFWDAATLRAMDAARIDDLLRGAAA